MVIKQQDKNLVLSSESREMNKRRTADDKLSYYESTYKKITEKYYEKV